MTNALGALGSPLIEQVDRHGDDKLRCVCPK
jgi:hypothetical protein